MQTICLLLPWPPTINHYYTQDWRNRRTVLGAAGRRYRAEVGALILRTFGQSVQIREKVRVWLDVYEPDHRRRDLDNITKAVFDAISNRNGHRGVLVDDSLIREYTARFMPCIEPGGKVVVTISEGETNGTGCSDSPQ